MHAALHSPTMPSGVLITFEGGEGTGKSTQVRLVADWLRARGREVVETREPGGTPLAERIRALLLDRSYDPDGATELFLLEAARRDHVRVVVGPAIERGAVVLSDRFADSSTVYQGAVRGLGAECVEGLNRLATDGVEPALTIVLDLPADEGVGRALARNAGTGGADDRLDGEDLEFHRRVREAYLALASRQPERVRVVDARGGADEVFERLVPLVGEAVGG